MFLLAVCQAFVAPVPQLAGGGRAGLRAALRCQASADELPEPDLSAWRTIRHQLSRSWEGDATGGDEGWAHTVPSPEPGCVMLAKPNVRFVNDPAKMLSVVLVLSHSEGAGTVGLALNRPTDHKLRRVLDGGAILEAFGDRPIHLGGTSLEGNGPSSASRLYMLTSRRPPAADELAQEVLPGLYLASGSLAADAVVRGEASADEYEFFAGFFAWGPGELEAEVRLVGLGLGLGLVEL